MSRTPFIKLKRSVNGSYELHCVSHNFFPPHLIISETLQEKLDRYARLSKSKEAKQKIDNLIDYCNVLEIIDEDNFTNIKYEDKIKIEKDLSEIRKLIFKH